MYLKSKNAFNRIIKNNDRGSAILTVLVASAFLAVIVSVLLSMSMTNFNMKTSDRDIKEAFYNAEEVLDEITANLKNEVSPYITGAFYSILTTYSEYSDNVSAQDAYEKAVVDAITGGTVSIFHKKEGTRELEIEYDLDVIRDYLVSDSGIGIVITAGDDTEKGEVVVEDGKVVLKDLIVSCCSDNGQYDSTVKADVVLGLPEFNSKKAVADIEEYIIVTGDSDKEGLFGESGFMNVELDGSIYAGKIDMTNMSGGTVTFTNNADKCVVKGDIDVGVGATLKTESKSNLWANRIKLSGNKPSVMFKGKTYINDDLELDGTNASASIGGRFYGFGSSTTEADESSSIIINGKNANIDFDGIEYLGLAGTGFISISSYKEVYDKYQKTGYHTYSYDTKKGSDIQMGESVTSKSTQMAYLIPAECVKGTLGTKEYSGNPLSLPNDSSLTNQELYNKLIAGNLNTVLWDGKKLGDYVKGTGDISIKHYVPAGSTSMKVVYFYMNFKDKDAAAEYFRGYFNKNRESMAGYFGNYAESLAKINTARSKVAGNSLYYDPADSEGYASTIGVIPKTGFFDPSNYERRYEELKVSHSEREDNDVKAVYDAVFSGSSSSKRLRSDLDSRFSGAIRNVTGGKIIEFDGNEEGIKIFLTAGDASYNDYKDCDLVIAGEEVDVDGDFKGLILAKDSVNLRRDAKIESSPERVGEALAAILGKISINGETTEAYSSGCTISYRNWEKM